MMLSFTTPYFFLLTNIELPLILITQCSVPKVIRDLRFFRRRDSIFLSSIDRSGLVVIPGCKNNFFPFHEDGLGIT